MCVGVGGGQEVRTPPEKSQCYIGFLSNTCPDPLKKLQNYQASIQGFGHHWVASETPFKWRFAGGPIMARLELRLDPCFPHQLSVQQIRVGPPLTKLSGSAHDCIIYMDISCG